jgi:hypothetical protein
LYLNFSELIDSIKNAKKRLGNIDFGTALHDDFTMEFSAFVSGPGSIGYTGEEEYEYDDFVLDKAAECHNRVLDEFYQRMEDLEDE